MITALIISSLWLHADFDHPLIVDGRICDVKMAAGKRVPGKFGRGYAFVSEKTRCENDFIVISDPDLLENFPWQEGSFSCFYRLPDGMGPMTSAPFFGYGGYWEYQWTWTGRYFSTENGNANSGRLDLGDRFAPTDAWRHFCATWNADELVCYYDGVKVASKKNPTRIDMRNVQRANLRIGTRGEGSGPANIEADEVSIYDHALSAAEVAALSASSVSAFPAARIVPGFVAFPIYWRNQSDAKLRMRCWSPKKTDGIVRLGIGGTVVFDGELTVPSGTFELEVPFDPSLFPPGRQAYTLTAVAKGGAVMLEDAGEIEIRGRVERDSFRMLSWGGLTALASSNLYALGLNSVNSTAGTVNREIRNYLRNDVFINWRLENSKAWQTFGFDGSKIGDSVMETLAAGKGLHLWASTLVNSEVYDTDMSEITNDVRVYARTKAGLGFDPDVRVRHPPVELDYNAKGISPYSGVMPADDTTLRTVLWYLRKGFPAYAVNAADRRAIRKLSPGNVVWSEPSPSPIGLDMVSDWIYDYKTESALQKMLLQYAHARAKGRMNQPTLAMCYAHTFPPSGRHPVTGDEVLLAQSCDEVMIKSWMALGAVRADHLSYFSADTWERGANGYAAYSASLSNKVEAIGEPDAISRFGRFVRTRLRPAIELLRGLDNVRAKVALVWLEETDRAGNWVWSRYHYRNQVSDYLARQPWNFDAVSDAELNSKTLAGYDYLLLPMLSVVTDEHDAILRSLPSSVRFVTDAHAKVEYPNGIRLADMKYMTNLGVLEFNTVGVDEPLGRYFADKSDELRRAQDAWSEEDGTNAHTFVKEYGGVKYVTVVNNARRAGGSPMNLFNTNAWYRPCAAAQTITTHFRVPADGAVYEFNARDAGLLQRRGAGEIIASGDYEPAEGRVFCVYPRPLTAMSVRIGVSRAGDASALIRIVVHDSAGLAPGRQVVEVTVRRPDGSLADESGLYRTENGKCAVTVRYTAAERASAASGGWMVSVRELTTGLMASTSSDPSRVRNWTGAVSSDWFDPANWSDGVPTEGDTVRIASSVDLTNSTPLLASLELGDGTEEARLTLSNPETTIRADVLKVCTNGVVTCEPCNADDDIINRVRISCADLTIATGGKIDVSEKGYVAPRPVIASYQWGKGPGRFTATGNLGGAPSHGGHGSRVFSMSSFSVTPLPYDDPSDPKEPGSSGTTSPYAIGGNGGGVVIVESTGTVTINGSILANGRNASSFNAAGWETYRDNHDGAGSGGTINIRCREIRGSGIVAADGGGGCKDDEQIPGMPAGGGCIAIRYDPTAQTVAAFEGMTVSAAAGLCKRGNIHAGTYTEWFQTHNVDADDNRSAADIGTVWMTDHKLLDALLGTSLTGQIRGISKYVREGDLAFNAGRVRFAEDGVKVKVTGNLTLGGDDSRLEIGGTVATNRSAYVDHFSALAPALEVDGDLLLGGVSRLDIRAAQTASAEEFGAFAKVGGTVTIATNCAIYVWSDIRTLGSVKFEVGGLTVSEGGLLSAFRRGGAGGYPVGSGLPSNCCGYGPGGTSDCTVGGGHGGKGGRAEAGRGGLVYDDEFRPHQAGSGGGGAYDKYTMGGFGGGLVFVSAPGGKIRIDGTVNANGENGIQGNGFGGGGSGGTIFLEAKYFLGGKNAILTACGGDTKPHKNVGSGSGGGGRIAVWCGAPWADDLRSEQIIRVPGSLYGLPRSNTFRYVSTNNFVNAGALVGTERTGTAGDQGTCWFTCVKSDLGMVMMIL